MIPPSERLGAFVDCADRLIRDAPASLYDDAHPRPPRVLTPYDRASLVEAAHLRATPSFVAIVVVLPALLLLVAIARARRAARAVAAARRFARARTLASETPIGAEVVAHGVIDERDAPNPRAAFTMTLDDGARVRIEPHAQLAFDEPPRAHARVFVWGVLAQSDRASPDDGGGYRDAHAMPAIVAPEGGRAIVARESLVASARRDARRAIAFAAWPIAALVLIQAIAHGGYHVRRTRGGVVDARVVESAMHDGTMVATVEREGRRTTFPVGRWEWSLIEKGVLVPCLEVDGALAQLGERATEDWRRIAAAYGAAAAAIVVRRFRKPKTR